jgi:predicted permease
VGLGFWVGKHLKLHRETIAQLLIYAVVPGVILSSILSSELQSRWLVIPLALIPLCCLMALLSQILSRKLLGEGPLTSVIAFSGGDTNSGYFGLPVAVILFGPEITSLMIFFFVSFIIYENTLGFYLLARGNFTVSQSLRKLRKLPGLYAFATALLLSHLGVRVTGFWQEYGNYFRGTYTVLGMMLIGIGVSSFDYSMVWKDRRNLKFLSLIFAVKHLLWPVVSWGFVMWDQTSLGMFTDREHQVMMLVSLTPLAANTVAFTSLLGVEPERSAFAVLVSTLLSVGSLLVWLSI